MVTAQKFVRNVYYHELARSLQRFGYGIENNPRGDFEIVRVGKELIDRFSKRHRQIDEKTREFLVYMGGRQKGERMGADLYIEEINKPIQEKYDQTQRRGKP